MRTNFPLPTRASQRGVMRFIGFGLVLFAASVQAADSWTDVSSSLLERLTNSGIKLAWPGGCSGVVVNRLNGDVTLKVVGCGVALTNAKPGSELTTTLLP